MWFLLFLIWYWNSNSISNYSRKPTDCQPQHRAYGDLLRRSMMNDVAPLCGAWCMHLKVQMMSLHCVEPIKVETLRVWNKRSRRERHVSDCGHIYCQTKNGGYSHAVGYARLRWVGGKPPKTPIMPKNVKSSDILSCFLFFASVEKEKQMAFCTK